MGGESVQLMRFTGLPLFQLACWCCLWAWQLAAAVCQRSPEVIILISLVCIIWLPHLCRLREPGKRAPPMSSCETRDLLAVCWMKGSRHEEKAHPKGNQCLWARQCFPPSTQTGTWMPSAWEDFSKQLLLVKVNEQSRPGSIFSSKRSHDARSVTLDPIFCLQGNNVYPLIKWPNRFGLLGLSRDHAIHFTPNWNLKQSLKLQTQKIDLKKPTQLCEELVNLKLKL